MDTHKLNVQDKFGTELYVGDRVKLDGYRASYGVVSLSNDIPVILYKIRGIVFETELVPSRVQKVDSKTKEPVVPYSRVFSCTTIGIRELARQAIRFSYAFAGSDDARSKLASFGTKFDYSYLFGVNLVRYMKYCESKGISIPRYSCFLKLDITNDTDLTQLFQDVKTLGVVSILGINCDSDIEYTTKQSLADLLNAHGFICVGEDSLFQIEDKNKELEDSDRVYFLGTTPDALEVRYDLLCSI